MTNKNMQWWKIALCVLGVLMIAGVVTYTLMTRASASSAVRRRPSRKRLRRSALRANAPASGRNRGNKVGEKSEFKLGN